MKTFFLLEVLITSSALILGIFALRRLTMGKISMRLRYGLWLLVAARLLTPFSLGTSPISVMNLFSDLSQMWAAGGETAGEQEKYGIETGNPAALGADGKNGGETVVLLQNPAQGTVGAGAENLSAGDGTDGTPGGSESGTTAQIGRVTVSQNVTWRFGILMAWICGFVAVSGYMLFLRFRFVRYLRGKRQEVSEEELPDAMGERFAARRMRVYRVKGLPSPCLVGRHIYIGKEMPGGEQGLLHVLAHEYCHALHGDGFWAFLRCALAALWWFDPLVWAAAFAARRDSDLACDESAVRFLGEEERFAYGRTLLDLAQESVGKTECPGMPLMFSGSERGVRERIVSLTERRKAETVVLAAVLSLVFLICGCAFTGAEREEAAAGMEDGGQQKESVSSAQNRDMVLEEDGEEFERIQKEYDEYVVDGYINTLNLKEEQIKELEEVAIKEGEQAAFEEALAYHGVMEGKDDSELSLNRKVDMQHFYEYNAGEREDAPEQGWYLLCRAEDEPLSVYGLFTKDFGCRGVKTLIGEDVNTFDLVWHPTVMNDFGEKNIKVLERAQDGLPRRFVWKYVEEESDRTEIWRLAGGYRYDTGTVDIKILSEEEYLSWADWHLTYGIDQEKGEVRVYYDGSENELAGILDISAYRGFYVEGIEICKTVVSFDLNSEIYGETAGEDYEKLAIHLVPGLKLAGFEELWIYDLTPIAVQLFWDEDEGFRMGKPKVDEQYRIQSPTQERKLEEIRNGETAGNGAQAAGEQGEDRLAKPLVYSGVHHQLGIFFQNPCPDYDRISDSYGERTNPVTGEVRVHNGVDLAAPAGTDIVAAAEGTVFETGFDAENGNYVVLYHGQSGQMTYYTHCKEVAVSEGDQVEAGEKIATVGSTGRSTGAHLHFALSYEGQWQEPVWGQRQRETE